jgi:hypothetical protein
MFQEKFTDAFYHWLQHIVPVLIFSKAAVDPPGGLIPFRHNLPPVNELIRFINACLIKMNTIKSH